MAALLSIGTTASSLAWRPYHVLRVLRNRAALATKRGFLVALAVGAAAVAIIHAPGAAGKYTGGSLTVGYAPQIFVVNRSGGAHRLTRGRPGPLAPAWAPDG